MDIWESAGHWYVNDDGKEWMFDTEQKARSFKMATELSERPVEEEFAEKILKEILPALRKTYMDMVGMQIQWDLIQEKTTTAKVAGENVAGFKPETWDAWGAMLLALQKFLATPIAELGDVTPQQVMMKRYQSEVK